MQSYSSQRNTTIADFQQIQVSTTLSKSSKWKVIEKAFPAPQLWTSSPKNHPTRYCIYTGGLIHQETPDTSSFQWAEAPQRFCTPSWGGRGSRLTICQLNQFNTNSEAAMLSSYAGPPCFSWCTQNLAYHLSLVMILYLANHQSLFIICNHIIKVYNLLFVLRITLNIKQYSLHGNHLVTLGH